MSYTNVDLAVKAMIDFSTLSKKEQENRQSEQKQTIDFLNDVCKKQNCDIHKLVLDYRIKRYSELTRGIHKRALNKEELYEYDELKSELIALDSCSRCYFETVDRIRFLRIPTKNKGIIYVTEHDKSCKFNGKRLFNLESIECNNFKLKLQ